MIYDLHAHIIGLQSGHAGNYLCPRRRMSLPLRIFLKHARRRVVNSAGDSADESIRRIVGDWVSASQVDRVVLLALDGVYRSDGSPDRDHTQVVVGNDFVADFAAGHPKLLFGASVHPYRRDAPEELDRVVRRGACLIKWLPSAQNIAPDDPRCDAFYERMAHHGIPLLTHTGVEHTLARFDNDLNAPRRLAPALRRGVTVIAAHCGTRMFLYERSYFKQWADMAREHLNFFGDLSTFGLPLHGGPLARILRDPDLLSKVLFGSDFPTRPLPMWSVARLGWRKARALSRTANPFDKTLLMLRELGVPETVFARAGRLLRLPQTQRLEGDAA